MLKASRLRPLFSAAVFITLFAYVLLGRAPKQEASPLRFYNAEVNVAMRPFAGLTLDQFFGVLDEIRPTLKRESRIDRAELHRRITRIANAGGRLDLGLLERWRAKLAPVFRVHQCEGRLTLFIFPDDEPFVMTHAGVLITLSTKSVQLAAGEAGLAGIVAHEVAHEYLASPLIVERLDRGPDLQREIELVCDGIAVATLIKLGLDPQAYAAALTSQIQASKSSYEVRCDNPTHPPLPTRLEMIRRVHESFAQAESAAAETETTWR